MRTTEVYLLRGGLLHCIRILYTYIGGLLFSVQLRSATDVSPGIKDWVEVDERSKQYIEQLKVQHLAQVSELQQQLETYRQHSESYTSLKVASLLAELAETQSRLAKEEVILYSSPSIYNPLI